MNNIVDLIDLGGNVRRVYRRYAQQRVRKGTARWVNGGTAVKIILPRPIVQVFPKIGTRLSVADAMQKLTAVFPADPYAGQKAAAALGGASRGRFISFDGTCWERTR